MYSTNYYKTGQILVIGILLDVINEVFWMKRSTIPSSSSSSLSSIVHIFRGNVVIEHLAGEIVDSARCDPQTGIEGEMGRKRERRSDGTHFLLDVLAI
jgi:hypothetical protein